MHGSGPEGTGLQRARSCLHASVFGVAAYLEEIVNLQFSSDADHTVADKDQNEASLSTIASAEVVEVIEGRSIWAVLRWRDVLLSCMAISCE